MPDREPPDLSETIRTPEPQTQGPTELDTTYRDKPAGLERPGEDMVGAERGEYGPLTTVPEAHRVPAPMDPTGDDPFIPGTGEGRDDFDADMRLTDRERHDREEVRRNDPTGEHGPSYEANQGTRDLPVSGTVDPHNELTHDTSGYVSSPDKDRIDVEDMEPR